MSELNGQPSGEGWTAPSVELIDEVPGIRPNLQLVNQAPEMVAGVPGGLSTTEVQPPVQDAMVVTGIGTAVPAAELPAAEDTRAAVRVEDFKGDVRRVPGHPAFNAGLAANRRGTFGPVIETTEKQ